MEKNVLTRRAIVAYPAVPQHPVPHLCQAQGWFLFYILNLFAIHITIYITFSTDYLHHYFNIENYSKNLRIRT